MATLSGFNSKLSICILELTTEFQTIHSLSNLQWHIPLAPQNTSFLRPFFFAPVPQLSSLTSAV